MTFIESLADKIFRDSYFKELFVKAEKGYAKYFF